MYRNIFKLYVMEICLDISEYGKAQVECLLKNDELTKI